MTFNGPTIALFLSILGVCALLFLYKLSADVRKHRIKNQRLTFKERLADAVHKRWK